MTKFHEQIRFVLTDVEKFCAESLVGVKLSKKQQQEKDKILKDINSLYDEYPTLKPEQENKSKNKDKDDKDVSDGSLKTNGSAHNEEDETAESYPDVALRDLENPVKCGYLDKKRKKDLHIPTTLFKQNQKRYCAIHKNIFYYYEKPTDKKQCGAFCLAGYQFKGAPEKVKEANKKDLCFELTAPNKRTFEPELVFIADSQEEFDSWKQAIETAAGTSEDVISGEPEEIYEAIGDNVEPESPDRPPLPSVPPPQTPSGESAKNLTPQEPDTEDIYEDAESANQKPETPPAPPTRNLPATPPSSTAPPTPARNPPMVPSIAPPTPPPARRSPLPELPPLPPTPTPTEPEKKKKIICPAEDFENMFYGKWDCTGNASDELTFKRGDIVHIINYDFDKDSWWVGELEGKFGLVPKEYMTRAYEEVAA